MEDLLALNPPPFSELVCLETSSEPAALDAFVSLAAARCPEPSRLLDVSVKSPSGEKWKASDLASVLYQLSLTPQHRHVLLLLAADAMDPAAVDMLLKTAEEPPAPMTLVLSAPSLSVLPVTLRSRVLAAVQIPVPLPVDALARLAELGLPGSFLDRADVHDLLSVLLAAPSELASRVVRCMLPGPDPVLTSQAFLAAFEELLSASGLPPELHKRLRRRAPRLVLALCESYFYDHPDLFSRLDLVPPRARLLEALDLSLNVPPHLAYFYVSLSGLDLAKYRA